MGKCEPIITACLRIFSTCSTCLWTNYVNKRCADQIKSCFRFCLRSAFYLVNFSCFQCLVCKQEQTDQVKIHLLMHFSLYAILKTHDDFSFQGLHFSHRVKRIVSMYIKKNQKTIAWKSLFTRGKFSHFHGLPNLESKLIEVQGIKV